MKFEMDKPYRLHRYFLGVRVNNHWWFHDSKRWVPDNLVEIIHNTTGEGFSSHAPCKTLRAFRRMLRKHPNIRGRAELVSRYVGYNVFA